jgi:hypothetical protein
LRASERQDYADERQHHDQKVEDDISDPPARR